MRSRKSIRIYTIPLILSVIFAGCFKNDKMVTEGNTRSIVDGMNREVGISEKVSRIICSGSGALRYITYMQCQDKVIAVDDIEKRDTPFDARPYAFANPGFSDLPLFGEFRGNDNPELIVALNPQPDLIFKTFSETGYNPVELQEKTGVPVIVFDYGDLGQNRNIFYSSLGLLGRVMNREARAQEIKEFIEKIIEDLNTRTENIQERKTCYLGGVAYRGPHGFQSTEPGYPPFMFLNTPNAAIDAAHSNLAHMDVSKEKIVEWDPEVVFIDLATFQSDAQGNAFHELTHDPAYAALQALETGNIYGILPYNWYTQNHGSTLANAYFIGKVLYPDKFKDIDPVQKADEIYTFLVGKPVFKEMNDSFSQMVYKKMEL